MSEETYPSILHGRKPKRSLSFNQKFFIALGVFLSILLLFIALIIYSLVPVNRVVAENVTVSAEWLEFEPSPALTSSKMSQYITLDVEGAKRGVNPDGSIGDTSPGDWNKIELSNGALATPEVQVVDEYGKVYNLHASMEYRDGKGYTIDFDSSKMTHFPQDRVYRMVRIRSDVPIYCKRIIWHCYNPK
jgi:hypothetical protein